MEKDINKQERQVFARWLQQSMRRSIKDNRANYLLANRLERQKKNV